MGTNPLAAFGVRSLQPVRPLGPVNPVVRRAGNAAPPADASNGKDQVTLGANTARAGVGLYTRKGTLTSSVERQQSFDLTIQTAEGDTATLHFAQSQGSSSAISAQSSPRGSRVETLQESHGALDLQITMQGSFSDEETQAMDALVQQASQVADQFFAGNTAAASAQADTLQLHSDALQSFSMDLHSQEMRRVSATYEEVARFTAPPPASAPATPAAPAAPRGTDLLQGLKQLLAQLVSDLQNPQQAHNTVSDAVDKTALA